MAEQKNIPEIRFVGFDDQWEQRTLGSYGVTYTGLSGKSKNDFGHGEGRYIPYMNVFSNPITNEKLVESVEIDGKQNEIRYGDVFFTTSSETPEDVGMTSIWIGQGEHIYLNSFCFGYRLRTKINSYYLAYMLRSPAFRKKIVYLAQGISRYNISKNKVMEIGVTIPSTESEQSKIGNFFQTLDSLITLRQRKYDKLLTIKKALLEKMFPRDGASLPELRFAGFDEPWEQRTLGDVVSGLSGGVSIRPNEYIDSEFRTIPKGAVNSSGVADLTGCKSVSEIFFKNNISAKVSTGDLVTSLRDLIPSGPNMGRVVKIVGGHEDFIMPQGVYKIQLYDMISEYFVITYSNTIKYRKIVNREKSGSTQVHLRNGDFLNIDISIPNNQEQTKIGALFQTFDTLITFQKQELDKLRQLKKALFEKMFV